jgi:hypothetical protein
MAGNSSIAGLVSLAFNAQVHDVVAANSAVVNLDVPGPERHRVPLFKREKVECKQILADEVLCFGTFLISKRGLLPGDEEAVSTLSISMSVFDIMYSVSGSPGATRVPCVLTSQNAMMHIPDIKHNELYSKKQ